MLAVFGVQLCTKVAVDRRWYPFLQRCILQGSSHCHIIDVSYRLSFMYSADLPHCFDVCVCDLLRITGVTYNTTVGNKDTVYDKIKTVS